MNVLRSNTYFTCEVRSLTTNLFIFFLNANSLQSKLSSILSILMDTIKRENSLDLLRKPDSCHVQTNKCLSVFVI